MGVAVTVAINDRKSKIADALALPFPPVATKTPDLNLLPIAVALYDELSVSRAARLLGMSQPAVSKALRRLRETFDDPLFVRRPSGIVATPRSEERRGGKGGRDGRSRHQ